MIGVLRRAVVRQNDIFQSRYVTPGFKPFSYKAQNVKTQVNKGVYFVKEIFTLNEQHSPRAFYYHSKDINILKAQESREE